MQGVRDSIERGLAIGVTSGLVERAREAQLPWSHRPIPERLKLVRRIRSEIAANSTFLLDSFPQHLLRTRADSLSAEVVPLVEACRFLELRAAEVLAPQQLSKSGRPFWLNRVQIEVTREPFGVVLLIGPSNYPLFLIGVQALQALVAGNAVVIKPGRGGSRVAAAFAELTDKAGLPSGLLTVLDEQVETATAAIRSRIDKVVLTGSVESGQAVLNQTAEHLLPATMELSGYDAVFVQESANVSRAVQAVLFGMKLNGGETCIVPRRVFVHESLAEALRTGLGDVSPFLSITSVRNDEEALKSADKCPYALGASIFGEENAARRLARRVRAGVVVVNDMIVPTADPRVPFGGRGLSGFGTTRGKEGLLDMTVPKAVVVQQAKRLRHLEPPPWNAEQLFKAYLGAVHSSGLRSRFTGWLTVLKAIVQSRKVIS